MGLYVIQRNTKTNVHGTQIGGIAIPKENIFSDDGTQFLVDYNELIQLFYELLKLREFKKITNFIKKNV